MYLSVVCTNTRFDVQIQIWITNNIQKKLIYCYRQIIIHTRFGLFNRLLLHSWTFRAQSAWGYIIFNVHILWQKFPEKLWMHIFIFFAVRHIVCKEICLFIHTRYICTFKLLPENTLFYDSNLEDFILL